VTSDIGARQKNGLLSFSQKFCIILKLVEGISFLGGFECDGAKTSGFFKLQKIRTLEKDMPRKSFLSLELVIYLIAEAEVNV